MKHIKHYIVLLGLLLGGPVLLAQDLNPAQWPNLKGYWKFQNAGNPLKATVGNDLVLRGSHSIVKGPSKTDTAVRIGTGSYYRCSHNIAPNGGGDSVNRYTLMFDFKILSLNRWHTFFQTDTTNTNDGECFIRPNTGSGPGRIGTATTGYTADTVLPNKWYRLVISVNLGHYYRYYLNGNLILEGDTQDVDDRFSLNPLVLLFADNNQEDDTIDIASVAIFDTCLSTAQIASIGTIDPCVLKPMSLSLGRDTALCGNNTLQKTLVKGYTYKWSTGDTASSVVFSVQKMGSGLKNVWVQMSDENQCIKADTFALGFYSYPNLNLGADQDICKPNSTTLVGGPAPGFSYEWKYLPAGNIVSKTNSMRTDSSGLYCVRVSSTQGCSAFDTIRIRVHDNTAKPVITANKTSFCTGDTAIVSGPAGYLIYQWSNGLLSRTQYIDSSISLRLRTTDNWGCVSPLSDLFRITSFPLPAAPDLRALGDTIFCEGDSCKLMVFGSYSSYHWSDSATGFARTAYDSGLYRAYVRDFNGCASPYSKPIRTLSLPAPVKARLLLASGQADLCPGDSLVLLCPDSAINYQWNNGKTGSWISVKSSGVHSVYTTNAYGCRGPASDSFSSTLHQIPGKPLINPLGRDSLICSDSAAEYRWFITGRSGFLSGRSIAAEDSAEYTLQVKYDYCWSEFSDIYRYIKTAVSMQKAETPVLQAFPNPGRGLFNIRCAGLSSSVHLKLFNTQGQCILNLFKTAQELESGCTLDGSALGAGVYLLQLDALQGALRLKLLVE